MCSKIKNNKVIFLDVDGTLVEPMERPSALTIEAIKKARENGHKVFICTGRNLPIISKEIIEIGFDGIIASAGGYIETDGKVLFDDIMPEEKVQECLRIFHKHDVYCRIEDKKGVYIDKKMEELLKIAKVNPANSELVRMQKEMEGMLDIYPFDRYEKKGAYKINFTCTSLEHLEGPKKEMGEEFHFVIYPFWGSDGVYNGEIIRKGIEKGDALVKICEYYGVPLSQTIAFGDSMNDYSMIKKAKLGIAMGNAADELKEAADMVCKSVKEEGIYHAFKELGLI